MEGNGNRYPQTEINSNTSEHPEIHESGSTRSFTIQHCGREVELKIIKFDWLKW